MNKQSIFFTCVVAIFATVLMLMAIQFLSKKLNIKQEKEEKTSVSYAVWLTSIMVSFFIFLKVALDLIENSIEVIIYSKSIDDTFITVIQKIATFTGFTFIFTFLSYYIVHNLLKILTGSRLDAIEMEKENLSYFLIKGITLILFVYSIVDISEHFLRWFMPTIETPFYH